MKKLYINICLMIGVIMLSACSANVADYAGTVPATSLENYFTGPIKAWGIVQDRSGKVVQRVDIDMVGEWNGDKGTLSEVLKYADGRIEKRKWNITKMGNNKYKGTADGIVGDAFGESNGFAIRWNYVMTIPVDGRNIDVTFDDWMYQLDDKIMVNRSYIKKFGFKVAELSLFMQKP